MSCGFFFHVLILLLRRMPGKEWKGDGIATGGWNQAMNGGKEAANGRIKSDQRLET